MRFAPDSYFYGGGSFFPHPAVEAILAVVRDKDTTTGEEVRGQRYKLVFTIEFMRGGTWPARNVITIRPSLRYIRKDGTQGRLVPSTWVKPTEPVPEAARDLLVALTAVDSSGESGRTAVPLFDVIHMITPDVELYHNESGRMHDLTRLTLARASAAHLRFEPDLSSTDPTNSLVPRLSLRDGEGSDLFRDEPKDLLETRGAQVLGVAPTRGTIAFLDSSPLAARIIDILRGASRPFSVDEARQVAEGLENSGDQNLSVATLPEELRSTQEPMKPVVTAVRRGPELVVTLGYRYGDRMVLDRSHTESWFTSSPDGSITVHRRSRVDEREAAQEFARIMGSDGYVMRGGTRLYLSLAKFVRTYGQELLSAGFEVRLDDKPLLRRPGELEFEVASTNEDWLDIRLQIDTKSVTGIMSSDEDPVAVSTAEATYILGDKDMASLVQARDLGLEENGSWHVGVESYGQLAAIEDLLGDSVNDNAKAMQAIRKGKELLRPRPAAATPEGFEGTLREYQKTGLGWLSRLRELEVGGCLADDMGLGKTVQTLALLAECRARGDLGLVVIVVPVSTLGNWRREAEAFIPTFRVGVHAGAGRAADVAYLREYDVILVSYATLRRDSKIFRGLQIDYLILDEAQAIKNSGTKTSQIVRSLEARSRLALTGTPVENRLEELWSLYAFLQPGMLASKERFRAKFVRPIEQGKGNKRDLLRTIIAPFLLRRRKRDVAPELPPREEIALYAELSSKQRTAYETIKTEWRDAVLAALGSGDPLEAGRTVIQGLLRLRQAALIPEIADPRFRGFPSAKLDLLWETLEDALAEGHRVLVFSQFTKVLDHICDLLDEKRVSYAYMDGSTTNRQSVIDRFQRDPSIPVFCLSLKAGGVGLNLTAADYVFLFDPWWNPAVENQAIDRAHRIGTTHHVFAYRLVASDTVEEKILRLQDKKRELANDIIEGDGSLVRSLSDAEIVELFS
jgi:superfamily II DNA or RNA helicase